MKDFYLNAFEVYLCGEVIGVIDFKPEFFHKELYS